MKNAFQFLDVSNFTFQLLDLGNSMFKSWTYCESSCWQIMSKTINGLAGQWHWIHDGISVKTNNGNSQQKYGSFRSAQRKWQELGVGHLFQNSFFTNNFIWNKDEMLVKCASDETSEFNTLYIKVKFNRWAHSVSDRLEMSLAERHFGIIEVRNGWFNWEFDI